eukprot:SAG11_NODE_6364_length_1328_cov_1.283157_1_plen_310_part_10
MHRLAHATPVPCRTYLCGRLSGELESCSDDYLCCGNGDLEEQNEEECDDGGNNTWASSGGCRPDCTLPRCGDGVVDLDEECDAAHRNSEDQHATCDNECHLNHCASSPCMNGGVCTTAEGSFSCACPEHFDGEFCEVEDICANVNPCQRDSVCTSRSADGGGGGRDGDGDGDLDGGGGRRRVQGGTERRMQDGPSVFLLIPDAYPQNAMVSSYCPDGTTLVESACGGNAEAAVQDGTTVPDWGPFADDVMLESGGHCSCCCNCNIVWIECLEAGQEQPEDGPSVFLLIPDAYPQNAMVSSYCPDGTTLVE